MTVEISVLIAVAGCFVGLAGWLAGRDKKISTDATWRGGVDAKLDGIRSGLDVIGADMKGIQDTISCHGERISVVEQSAKQAHHRIDGLEAKMK